MDSIALITNTVNAIASKVNQLIIEHGSSEIFREKVELLKREVEFLERQLRYLQIQNRQLIEKRDAGIIANLNELDTKAIATYIDDPKLQEIISGLALQYISKQNNNQDALIFLSGLGLDYLDFKNHIKEFYEYDCFSLSLLGFEPFAPPYDYISFSNHVKIIAAAIKKITSLYERVYIVGFSIGADIILNAANTKLLPAEKYYILALDPNINEETCFITKKIAAIKGSGFDLDFIDNVASANECHSVEEWMSIARYLIRIIGKFNSRRIKYLVDFAKDVSKKYRDVNSNYFCNLINGIGNRYIVVFSDMYRSIKSFNECKCIKNKQIELTKYSHFQLRDDITIISDYINKLKQF